MHTDDAVVDLAATTEPLPRGPCGMAAALGCPRFVEAADRLRMSMFAGNQLLTVVAHARLIPLDGFRETL
jgi:hypothetical protein